jgi:anti-sigma-K factor RskA
VHEYRDAATALPLSLEPATPSPAVKARLMASVAGRAPRSAPVFTRLFWSAAAVLLVALIVRSLPTEMRELAVAHPPGTSSVEGTLRCSGRSVDFHITGLPACPPGKCYQLWHIGTDRKAVPLATFHPGPDGVLCGADAMKRPVARDHLLAFTMEPEGGSLQPTMPIYAFAKY